MEKGIKRPKHKTTRQWWGERMQEAETVMDAACDMYVRADDARQAVELDRSRGNAILIASALAMKDKAATIARDALKDERARLDAETARVEKVHKDNVALATEIAVKGLELAEKIQEIEFITGEWSSLSTTARRLRPLSGRMNGGAVGRTATASLAFSLALRLRAKVLLAAGSRPPHSKSPTAPPPSGVEP